MLYDNTGGDVHVDKRNSKKISCYEKGCSVLCGTGNARSGYLGKRI